MSTVWSKIIGALYIEGYSRSITYTVQIPEHTLTSAMVIKRPVTIAAELAIIPPILVKQLRTMAAGTRSISKRTFVAASGSF